MFALEIVQNCTISSEDTGLIFGATHEVIQSEDFIIVLQNTSDNHGCVQSLGDLTGYKSKYSAEFRTKFFFKQTI